MERPKQIEFRAMVCRWLSPAVELDLVSSWLARKPSAASLFFSNIPRLRIWHSRYNFIAIAVDPDLHAN